MARKAFTPANFLSPGETGEREIFLSAERADLHLTQTRETIFHERQTLEKCDMFFYFLYIFVRTDV